MPADPVAGRTVPDMAPPADGCDRDAEQVGDLLDCQEATRVDVSDCRLAAAERRLPGVRCLADHPNLTQFGAHRLSRRQDGPGLARHTDANQRSSMTDGGPIRTTLRLRCISRRSLRASQSAGLQRTLRLAIASWVGRPTPVQPADTISRGPCRRRSCRPKRARHISHPSRSVGAVWW